MVYCTSCGKSVYSQGIDCPECGNRLPEPSGERKLPRIVGEELAEPDKQPLINNSQYQQQDYQPEYQEQPQPAFQQQYYQPHEQEKSEKAGLMPLIFIIIGGILAMICAVTLFRTTAMGMSITVGMDFLENNYTYAWLIPISGMLAMIFGIIGYLKQKRIIGLIIVFLGILAFILPLVLAAHISSEGELAFGEVFYYSETQTGFGFTSTFSNIYIGGILAMIGGIILIIGGFLFFMKTKKVEKAFKYPYHGDY